MSSLNLHRTALRAARRMERRGLRELPMDLPFELVEELREAGFPTPSAQSTARPRPFAMATSRGDILPRGEPELVDVRWSLPWVADAVGLFIRRNILRTERAILLRWFREEPELVAAALTTERVAAEAGLHVREVLREAWFQRSMAGEVAVFPRTSHLYRGRAFT